MELCCWTTVPRCILSPYVWGSLVVYLLLHLGCSLEAVRRTRNTPPSEQAPARAPPYSSRLWSYYCKRCVVAMLCLDQTDETPRTSSKKISSSPSPPQTNGLSGGGNPNGKKNEMNESLGDLSNRGDKPQNRQQTELAAAQGGAFSQHGSTKQRNLTTGSLCS